MNKRLLSRLMCEHVNGLRNSGVYFFRDDFEHILQGVVLEYVPRGVYVGNFLFPMFDPFGPHLSYSSRLAEHPFIAKGEMSELSIVDFVMDKPELRSILVDDKPMSLIKFFNEHLLEFDARRNPHFQLVQAAALVLLGEDVRAAKVLSNPPPTLHRTDVPHWNQLEASLKQGPEAARALLDGVRKTNMQKLGIA
jgi:hypothetical protein